MAIYMVFILDTFELNGLAAELRAEGPSAPAACSPAAGVEHAAPQTRARSSRPPIQTPNFPPPIPSNYQKSIPTFISACGREEHLLLNLFHQRPNFIGEKAIGQGFFAKNC